MHPLQAPELAPITTQYNEVVGVRARKGGETDAVRIANHPRYLEVGQRVLELMGVANDPRFVGHHAPVDSWLKAGFDPDADIYPTVQRLCADKAPGTIRSLKYFSAAIAQSHADRMAGVDVASPSSDRGSGRRRMTGAEEFDAAFAAMDRMVLGDA